MLNSIEEEMGTPARIGTKFEISEPTLVAKNLFSRYDLKKIF
jgi:hypothetical protein